MDPANKALNSEKTSNRVAFIINVVYFALIAAIIFMIFKYVIGWILPFILGFAIAYMFRPIVLWLGRALKFKRNIASFIVTLLGFGLLGFLCTILIANLLTGLTNLLEEFPHVFNDQIYPALEKLSQSLARIAGSTDAGADGLDSIRELILSLTRQAGTFITGLTASLPAFLIGFLFTILASLFISIYYEEFTGFILRQMPGRARKLTRDVKKLFLRTLGKYFRAAIILMMVTFIELCIGFLIIGIENPILTAAGIAVFDALPVFGTGGIMVPWFLLELLRGDYTMAIGLIIIYGVVAIVRSLIEPKVVGDQLGLNPLVSIIAVYLGFVLAGIPGMILMPITFHILITLNRLESIKLYRMED